MNALGIYKYKFHSEKKKRKLKNCEFLRILKNPFLKFLKFPLSIYAPLIL